MRLPSLVVVGFLLLAVLGLVMLFSPPVSAQSCQTLDQVKQALQANGDTYVVLSPRSLLGVDVKGLDAVVFAVTVGGTVFVQGLVYDGCVSVPITLGAIKPEKPKVGV